MDSFKKKTIVKLVTMLVASVLALFLGVDQP